MPEHSPSPRRHRSSFRAPAPDSVDPATLNRVFGDDAFEESTAARAEESSTHDDDGARHRRVADRAAERLAARAARANDHRAGPRPIVAATDAPTTPLSIAESVERPVLAARHPDPVFDTAGTGVGFDDLIAPQTFDASGHSGAALGSGVAPARDAATSPVVAPAGAAEPATDAVPATDAIPANDAIPATEAIATIPGIAIPATDAIPATEAIPTVAAFAPTAAAPTRDAAPTRAADDLLAALDPEGLLERSAEPSAPVAPPRRRPERARARTRRTASPRVLVVSAAAALLVVGGVGVAIAGVTSSAPSAPEGTSSSESRDAVEAAPTATITGGLSETAAPVTGGTAVSVAGEHLDEVAQVSVGGAEASIVDASADRLTFTVPPAADDAPGEVPVVFSDAQGNPATAGAGSLTLTYTPASGVEAQLDYVSEHWNAYNPDYPTLPGQDSVNFASQSLVARGWSMDDVWNADGETGTMSAAWSGATALRDYLRTRTDRATELTDDERGDVKPGDIAQFDWDDSGDRDFTAVVTRVEHTDAGSKVWITAHSNDVEAWDVDSALASGGTVTYFSIR